MSWSRQYLLVKRYVALISSIGPSVHAHELKVAMCAAANIINAAQQFRCNYDTKNGNTSCQRIPLVWVEMFFNA